MLRADATTGESIDEERGIADIAKKFGTKAKGFMKDRYHWLYVHWKSSAMNQDETAQLFLKKNIHPDKVKKWLGIAKSGDGPERELFLKYEVYGTACTGSSEDNVERFADHVPIYFFRTHSISSP
ncbi:hypothetical protein PRNP1_010764 [Phytophthora ramorum]